MFNLHPLVDYRIPIDEHGIDDEIEDNYPRLVGNSRPALEQGVLFLCDRDEESTMHVFRRVPGLPDLQPHRAYNLSPFFDLTNDMELYAYQLDIPDWAEYQRVTLLPQPTEHYDSLDTSHGVDLCSNYYKCNQTYDQMKSQGLILNSRIFVSLPRGGQEIRDSMGNLVLTDVVRNIVYKQGTFWFFMWNNVTGFSYTMRYEALGNDPRAFDRHQPGDIEPGAEIFQI